MKIDDIILVLIKLKGNLRFMQMDIDEIVTELEKINEGEIQR